MEHTFWHDKWAQNQTGFHLDYVHPLLKRNLGLFQVKKGEMIFVPLCGKTNDIGFLISQGYEVVAVELSEIAIIELFQQLNIEPTVSVWQEGKLYQAESIRIFVGDFFKLTSSDLMNGPTSVSYVYDRAALVALPEVMRKEYALHLSKITHFCPQLLITLDYDQSIAGGPPFAVSPLEVEGLYGGTYPIALLEEADIIEEEPRFQAKGLTSFYQRAYKLK